MQSTNDTHRRLARAKDACDRFSHLICRSSLQALLANGTIPSHKVGRARIVDLDDIEAFLAGRPVGTEVGR